MIVVNYELIARRRSENASISGAIGFGTNLGCTVGDGVEFDRTETRVAGHGR